MSPLSKKGRNTFKGYQDAKQKRREELITDYLTALKNSRATFKYKTDLAAYVAEHIAREEQGHCDRATLLRNPRYECLLVSYMKSTISGGTQSLTAADLVAPEAKALVAERDLTISNLRRELERLSAYCEQLEAKLNAKGHGMVSTMHHTAKVENFALETDYKIRFVKTCQALRLVLDYVPSQFLIDMDNALLKDDTFRRNKPIVVEAGNFRPYVEWLEKAPK